MALPADIITKLESLSPDDYNLVVMLINRLAEDKNSLCLERSAYERKIFDSDYSE